MSRVLSVVCVMAVCAAGARSLQCLSCSKQACLNASNVLPVTCAKPEHVCRTDFFNGRYYSRGCGYCWRRGCGQLMQWRECCCDTPLCNSHQHPVTLAQPLREHQKRKTYDSKSSMVSLSDKIKEKEAITHNLIVKRIQNNYREPKHGGMTVPTAKRVTSSPWKYPTAVLSLIRDTLVTTTTAQPPPTWRRKSASEVLKALRVPSSSSAAQQQQQHNGKGNNIGRNKLAGWFARSSLAHKAYEGDTRPQFVPATLKQSAGAAVAIPQVTLPNTTRSRTATSTTATTTSTTTSTFTFTTTTTTTTTTAGTTATDNKKLFRLVASTTLARRQPAETASKKPLLVHYTEPPPTATSTAAWQSGVLTCAHNVDSSNRLHDHSIQAACTAHIAVDDHQLIVKDAFATPHKHNWTCHQSLVLSASSFTTGAGEVRSGCAYERWCNTLAGGTQHSCRLHAYTDTHNLTRHIIHCCCNTNACNNHIASRYVKQVKQPGSPSSVRQWRSLPLLVALGLLAGLHTHRHFLLKHALD